MSHDDRYNAQVAAAWNAVKGQSIVAWEELRQINEVNLEALKAEGVVKNSITIEDIGNFVISPELHKEIVGWRNDFIEKPDGEYCLAPCGSGHTRRSNSSRRRLQQFRIHRRTLRGGEDFWPIDHLLSRLYEGCRNAPARRA